MTTQGDKTIHIPATADFTIDGAGSSDNWKKAEWIFLKRQSAAGADYTTKAKLLYSGKGIYCLFDCEDKRLTNTMQEDFVHLWEEDVVEVFLQPDPAKASYFEYELSPFNFELPLLIYNEGGKLNGWLPFQYSGEHKKTRHATSVRDGAKQTGATVTGWVAEFFIPYFLMKPVLAAVPKPGDTWRGNLYRIDYDEGRSLNSWSQTTKNFHEPEHFGSLRFG